VKLVGSRYSQDSRRVREFLVRNRMPFQSVYYAATQAEAHLCAGDPVLIVGGGNSAGQAAMFLSRHAAGCRLMIRGGDLAKSMSRYLIDELERRPQVELMTYTELEAKALFVFIGADPHTGWLRGHVAMDDGSMAVRLVHQRLAGGRGCNRACDLRRSQPAWERTRTWSWRRWCSPSR